MGGVWVSWHLHRSSHETMSHVCRKQQRYCHMRERCSKTITCVQQRPCHIVGWSKGPATCVQDTEKVLSHVCKKKKRYCHMCAWCSKTIACVRQRLCHVCRMKQRSFHMCAHVQQDYHMCAAKVLSHVCRMQQSPVMCSGCRKGPVTCVQDTAKHCTCHFLMWPWRNTSVKHTLLSKKR